MTVMQFDGDNARLELSYEELILLKNCINEAILLVPDDEFEMRVDATVQESRSLRNSLFDLLGDMRKAQS